VELETITIEKDFATRSLESLDYFSTEDIQSFASNSPEEIVDYSTGVDLRKRSSFGIQQDLSLRGSIFEDTDVYLGDIAINDPQTGHFNLEIPLTSADLDEVKIFKNAQQLHFLPKKPQERGGLIRAAYGEHALWEELISLNFSLKDIKNRISVEHKNSSGARQDTDFDIYNFSFHSLFEGDTHEVELLFGSTKRDFGANSFYSAFFPHQEEHITQQFYFLRGGFDFERFDLTSSVYFRRHTDKYILNRHNPPFYTNYHTTYVYGLMNEILFTNDTFIAFDIAREKIMSTNLNKHHRLRKGMSVGLKEKQMGRLIVDCEAGLDYYEDWQYLENFHLTLSYLLQEELRLRLSTDRRWRVPSFTELYFLSPSNRGNTDLGVQKSTNIELGLDYATNNMLFSVSPFVRLQSDTIDWVKNVRTDPWQAENVGRVNAYGADAFWRMRVKECVLDELTFGYTYLTLSRTNPYGFSKYVFDYNRHKAIGSLGFDLGGVKVHATGNYAHPLNRRSYTTVDLKIQKQLAAFNIFLEGTNIFNRDYEELIDV